MTTLLMQFSKDEPRYLLSEMARKDPLITKCSDNLFMPTAKWRQEPSVSLHALLVNRKGTQQITQIFQSTGRDSRAKPH